MVWYNQNGQNKRTKQIKTSSFHFVARYGSSLNSASGIMFD